MFAAGRHAPDNSPAAGRHRILVAEDGLPFRKALVRMLESAGFEVEAFAGGEAAMERLVDVERPRFDLVLADLRMPGIGGEELIAGLRVALADPPACLLMSGDVLPPPATASVDHSHPEILAKPFGVDELLAAIGRALG